MINNCDPLDLAGSGLDIAAGTTRQAALEAIVAEIERLGTTLTNPWTEITSGAPTPAGLQYLAKDLSGDAVSSSSDLKHISMYREGDLAGEEKVIRFCVGTYGHNGLLGDLSMNGEFGAEVTGSRDWAMMWTNDVSIQNDQAEDKIVTEGSAQLIWLSCSKRLQVNVA